MTRTATTLITTRKAYPARPMLVHDRAQPGHPLRTMEFVHDKVGPAVIIRAIGLIPSFIERIELTCPDTNLRLTRYSIADQ